MWFYEGFFFFLFFFLKFNGLGFFARKKSFIEDEGFMIGASGLFLHENILQF